MPSRKLLAGVAGILALPLAVDAHAAKPSTASLTIAATPSTVTFGRATTLSGTLAGARTVAGESIVVQADRAPFEGDYADVTTVLTDATGHWHATATPTALTRYRARARTAPPTTSATTDVRVRLRVRVRVSDRTPEAGQLVRFRGTAAPAHDGARVRIQRRESQGWVTVARTRLRDAGDAVSRYRRRVRVYESGVYRVRVSSGDTDHLRGTSRRRTLTVSG